MSEPKTSHSAAWRGLALTVALAAALSLSGMFAGAAAAAPCDPPVTNPVACENTKAGNPASEWDISGSGDPNIQGFATDISVNKGELVRFKVNSVTSNYRIDIYRTGYYGGLGARKQASVTPLTAVPTQPACTGQTSTGLTDCGNWSESASWNVPADAVSGVYIARLVRLDTGGASHIIFIVRDDGGNSKLLFQTSDTTWQAYNRYGGNSLYTGSPVGRAYKVSYNRPFTTRAYAPEDWYFNSEYPMVRWLERNGYDVSYSTDVDSDRRGGEIQEHLAFLSVGHDEYWSAGQRANVEAARAAGVHLAFFSGNEVFWKTRWENSIDGSATPHRTLVSYKETHAGAKIDPNAAWTGTWRDPRFSPPADGGKPENSLTGQLFMVNDGATTAIEVPAADGKMRFWRNTSVANLAAGTTATLADLTLGYEWDVDADNGSRPAGSVRLSSTTVTDAPVLDDYGSSYSPGTARHNLTFYRAPSGALVFGAGTVQWPWGLDATHDRGPAPAPDTRMQQATVNLFADMGVQPGTLQSGLTAATQSTDTTGPTATIGTPTSGAQVTTGTTVNVSGTATDTGGGVVGGVEVSLDDGATWHPATGRSNWTYSWTPASPGTYTLKVRAADDSANLGAASAGTVVAVTSTCCSIWDASATPTTKVTNDTNAVELGVKFRAQTDGQITGLRFYKGATSPGPHIGHLWTRGGTRLAEVTFTAGASEGWQQANLATPVAISANTTYVASYHAPGGRYAGDTNYFASQGVTNDPLRALQSGEDGGNGVYAYGPSGTFPTNTFNASNYWVDVVFRPNTTDTTPPTVSSTSPVAGATGVIPGSDVRATFSEAMDPATLTTSTVELRAPDVTPVSGSVSYSASSRTVTFDPSAELAPNTTYTATIKGGPGGAQDTAGNPLASNFSWSFTTGNSAASGCPCTIWAPTATPTVADVNDNSAVEVGVKFKAQADGKITALRFYKGAGNTGAHVGHLWTASGLKLAEIAFTSETAQGWQQAALDNPVSISAGTTYIASYHAGAGHYAADSNYFAASGVDRGPLRALQNGESGGNGVYGYGPSGTFPNSTFNASNYWVDVVFEQHGAPDTNAPTITTTSPADGATGVALGANLRASFNEQLDPSTVSGSTVELRGPGGTLVPAAVSYDNATRSVTLNPTDALTGSTIYTATVKGGPAGIKDVAGNALASDRVWSFLTTADATGDCPCSIWDDSATPATASVDDSGAVEVGVKFHAKFDGAITGLRFYKGAGNTGSHVGHLWTTGGQQLAEARFEDESDSGWQQVILPTPVNVNAGTTYVASYHAPSGHYSHSPEYFTSSAVDNGPLRALARGEDGDNAVFRYGPSGTYPSQSFNSGNYWVDVIFENTGAGTDTKPPKVSSISPPDTAIDVGQGTAIRATFNEAINPATVNGSTFQLRAGGTTIGADVSYSAASRTATLRPRQSLEDSTSFTATVKGGSGGVTDSAGNPLAADRTWSFTTAAAPPPPPDDGPGGPIAVVTKSSIPLTGYLAEIVRAEGLNEFTTKDISTITPATIGAFDTVVLGSMPLTDAQVSTLTDFVNAGGNLIAMRPDGKLASLLGLVDSDTSLSEGWLKLDTTKAPGAGIVGETMQFHGTADRYVTNGATTVATLYQSSTASTPNPAVTVRDVGTNGGQAAAFTFDLARSIVQTRQGNPAWEGQNRDGAGPVRSDDLFFGGTQPDWVDLEKVDIPQADEQQRLLANLIGHVNKDKKPLPRFWYLPNDKKAVVVMTGDDHARGGTKGRFDQLKAESPASCSVAQWECLRMTSYMYPDGPLTDAEAAAYDADGFEIGLHPTTNCQDYTAASLDTDLTNQLTAFRNRYTSLPAVETSRTHCIVWSDWAGTPKAELQRGIRLDTNYYYWPSGWVNNRPGVFTGSGMPMRFADKNGALIDVYQATTQMTDESGQSYPFTSDTLLDNALGTKGYYGAFTANMHTDDAQLSDSDAIVQSARSRGVSVISARQLLRWLDGRNSSAFRSLSWSGNELSFTIDPAAGATGLRAMLPTAGAGSKQLDAITRGGSAVAFDRKTIKGVEYAVFDAVAGDYAASYLGRPIASFTATPNPAATGTTVSFNAGASSDPDGTITKYEWDLDGNGSYETDTGTATTASRSYSNNGIVTVGLRVTDNEGQTGTTTRAVTITNRAPAASFTISPSPASTRQTVTFNGSASSDPDGTVSRYEWDLDGNGTYETDTGTTPTTTRVYSTVGTITVRLRATDDDGLQAITTRSLTINSVYRAGIVGTAGVNGYWRFTTTGGTTASEVSPANTGSFTNGPFVTGALIAGEVNNARNFDGANDFVNLSATPVGTPPRVSVEAWARTDTTKGANGYHFLASNAATDFNDGFSLVIDSQNRPVFAIGGRSGGTVVRGQAVGDVALTPGTIYHLVGTYDQTAVRIYVNGVERGSAPFTNGIFYASGRDLQFARQVTSSNRSIRHLDGTLDEVAIYTAALSEPLIQSHYTLGAP